MSEALFNKPLLDWPTRRANGRYRLPQLFSLWRPWSTIA